MRRASGTQVKVGDIKGFIRAFDLSRFPPSDNGIHSMLTNIKNEKMCSIKC